MPPLHPAYIPLPSDLALRVLYVLHSASSSSPFDAMSYALFHPFIERVLQLGGAGQPDEEGSLEQITLATEVLQFHVPKREHPSTPMIHVPTHTHHTTNSIFYCLPKKLRSARRSRGDEPFPPARTNHCFRADRHR